MRFLISITLSIVTVVLMFMSIFFLIPGLFNLDIVLILEGIGVVFAAIVAAFAVYLNEKDHGEPK